MILDLSVEKSILFKRRVKGEVEKQKSVNFLNGNWVGMAGKMVRVREQRLSGYFQGRIEKENFSVFFNFCNRGYCVFSEYGVKYPAMCLSAGMPIGLPAGEDLQFPVHWV
ncbi:MAG: hypothetical protein J6J31_05840 [Thermoguttaceae bacterium]|nr:hypothetical protein [Thermoguttaceae bacterium]